MAGDGKKLQPIIIKRIKKTGHAAHGGAWKIAYADFVTAMMAFFLLMWLLGSTTQGDLKGISEYFQSPLRVSMSGGAGSGDFINLRGFDASNDIAIDGFADRLQYSRSDVFNLEQIEVYKGANTALSGAGGAATFTLTSEGVPGAGETPVHEPMSSTCFTFPFSEVRLEVASSSMVRIRMSPS